MGVHGLWELLAPVGRRVSVETLSGKKLAIDASIWMVQFMKAMRDERGEMVRNAHLLGFFRRICKLLFLRTKPVFVFDGGTPALKRRTVAARRRHRENARAKIRKTAEKLLLNHFKSKRLEELAEEIKRSNSDAKDGSKGKKVDLAEYGSSGLENDNSSSVRNDQGFVGDNNQESLDELLAASIAAEEEAKLPGTEPLLADDAKYEEESEEDGEDEMILPLNCKSIDPAVLASLPPSMQLDLLDQMRERLMADNRQKYQTIKKVPAKFSELQIQSYLKTVAFRREIDKVQKCASGRGFGGLQTSRIASEANREYIFSSSFTGDKNMLAPTGTEKNGSTANQELMKTSASDTSKQKLFLSVSNSTIDTNSEEVVSDLSWGVETYMDDRGRARASRVRGLGIHMTRDLQRNLDLMKEREKVFDKHDLRKVSEPSLYDESGFQKGHSKTEDIPIPSLISGRSSHCYTSTPIAVSVKEAAIEISFSEDAIESNPMVDNFFVSLVSEKPTTDLFPESASMDKKMDDSESECIWEDGVVGELNSNFNFEDNQLSNVESKGYEEDKVVWEEAVPPVSRSVESQKAVSLGFLEEEADLKEAIRRSLEDIKLKRLAAAVPVETYTIATLEDQHSLISTNNDLNVEILIGNRESQSVLMGQPQSAVMDCTEESSYRGNGESQSVLMGQPQSAVMDCTEESSYRGNGESQSVLMGQPQSAVMDCTEESSHRGNAHHFNSSQKEHLSTSLFASRLDLELTLQDEKNNIAICSNDLELSHDNQVLEKRTNLSLQENLCSIASKLMVDEPNFGKTNVHTKNYSEIDFENPCSRIDTDFGDPCDDSVPYPSTGTFGISSSMPSSSRSVPELGIDLFKISPTEQITSGINEMQQLASSEAYKDFSKGPSNSEKTSVQDEDNIVALKASLHNEISFLEQERSYLGDEQRKLERNADSVSSEMFADCQELLQMFGLPYIIAPMEAEAQCAYMEMTDLVDGIVTDDSDVFLFGARNVYKNIFDDRKYVETYFMKEIESELGLSRDKLIRIALLLGSDYTEGVSVSLSKDALSFTQPTFLILDLNLKIESKGLLSPQDRSLSGIGIVNAIEVINAFPEKDGLQKFRDWVESPDPAILGDKFNKNMLDAIGNASCGMKENLVCSEYIEGTHQSLENTMSDAKSKAIFMDEHRNVSKNWHFPPLFPSDSVISAYLSPQIDDSTEPFAWGKPDLPLLRKVCWDKFGWPNQKAVELLVPVLKEYNKHEVFLLRV